MSYTVPLALSIVLGTTVKGEGGSKKSAETLQTFKFNQPNNLQKHVDVSENRGTPKSSILIGLSIL